MEICHINHKTPFCGNIQQVGAVVVLDMFHSLLYMRWREAETYYRNEGVSGVLPDTPSGDFVLASTWEVTLMEKNKSL